jgi:hypothetical protein
MHRSLGFTAACGDRIRSSPMEFRYNLFGIGTHTFLFRGGGGVSSFFLSILAKRLPSPAKSTYWGSAMAFCAGFHRNIWKAAS